MSKDTFIVFSLSRSGHHAVMNWIAEQYDGPLTFHNHCIKGWENNELKPYKGRKKHYTSKNKTRSGDMYSIEDFDMSDYHFVQNSKQFKEAENKYCIIIVRDLYNLLASCLKSYPRTAVKYKEGIVDDRGVKKENNVILWTKQIQECLGDTNVIDDCKKVFISYNDWFSDKEYRKQICEELDIEFTDSGLQAVPNFGGGSGFDKLRKNNKAQSMDVLNRYKKFLTNGSWIDIISSNKSIIADLNKRMFNKEYPL